MGGDRANPRGPQAKAQDAVDRHVGGRLAGLRTAQGLSETEFARRIGVTGPTLRRYETGRAPIGASLLFRATKLLKVPIEHFYEGLASGGPSAMSALPSPGQDPAIRRELVELARNFSRIPEPDTRKRILKFVRSLAEDQK